MTRNESLTMSREPTLNDSSKACWDDFAVGDRWVTGAHLATKEEILAFGKQYDPEPFHRDEEEAKASMMGGLIASGIQMAAWYRNLHCLALPDVGWTLSPGWDNIRFVNSVRPGDVLTLHIHVTDMRPSASRPDWGIINWSGELKDANGETKLACDPIIFYRRRSAMEAESA